MSKSRGNVISAEEILKKFGENAMRLYLLKEGPYDRDESFVDQKISSIFNAHAVNEYGSLPEIMR